jgi:hypothetical protein
MGTSQTPDSFRERVEGCLDPLRGDLLWVMSRAGQELFHSNTLGFLMESYPGATVPLRRLFEGEAAAGRVETWRELHQLDLVGRSETNRYVVENKLYSIPYPEQLLRYLAKPLPWEPNPPVHGAAGTNYVLLSLMEPTFGLPTPWSLCTYAQVSSALGEVEANDVGPDRELFLRYRTMVRHLIALKDAVDPRREPDEPFSIGHLLGDPQWRWFAGPLQRMRYSGLLELVRAHHSPVRDFAVGLSNTRGRADYLFRLNHHRFVGWQLQGDDLRLVVLFREPSLHGRGQPKKDQRAEAAESQWAEYFDFGALASDVESVLSPIGGSKVGAWNHFDPDFVYRYRRIAPTTSSAELARALASLTKRAEEWVAR